MAVLRLDPGDSFGVQPAHQYEAKEKWPPSTDRLFGSTSSEFSRPPVLVSARGTEDAKIRHASAITAVDQAAHSDLCFGTGNIPLSSANSGKKHELRQREDSSKKKRRSEARRSNEPSESHGERGDEENPSPNAQVQVGNGEPNDHIFICPYFRADPLSYHRCFGLKLNGFSRVKQHIERVHTLKSLYCPRCYKDWKDKDERDWDLHIKRGNCQPVQRKQKLWPGDIRELFQRGMRGSDEDKWRCSFRRLFPGYDDSGSPYARNFMVETFSYALRWPSVAPQDREVVERLLRQVQAESKGPISQPSIHEQDEFPSGHPPEKNLEISQTLSMNEAGGPGYTLQHLLPPSNSNEQVILQHCEFHGQWNAQSPSFPPMIPAMTTPTALSLDLLSHTQLWAGIQPNDGDFGSGFSDGCPFTVPLATMYSQMEDATTSLTGSARECNVHDNDSEGSQSM